MKKTCAFVLAGERVKIEFESEPVQRQAGLTVDLKPLPVDASRYSFTGTFSGGGGQIVDRLAELAKRHNATEVQRLCELWDSLHLNDMKAGTRKQNALLTQMPARKPGEDHYTAATAFLDSRWLLVDNGYRYGSSWLYEPVDPADVTEAVSLLDALDGQRIGKAEAAEDADAELAEAEFSNSSDVIDSRDVIKRIEELTDFLADHPNHEDAADELKTLRALESEAESSGDWEHGETLIRDSYFEEYAQQLADDIGAINAEATWPNNCIDWERAARELQQDYTSVEFGGVTYWLRS